MCLHLHDPSLTLHLYLPRIPAPCTNTRETHGWAAGRPPRSEARRAARPVQNPESMSLYRKYLRIAGLVAGIVSPAFAASLSAQGGGQARRAVAAPSSDAAAREALIEPARSMLRHLVGRWRVEIRFAGNFDGPPDASGTRVVAPLFDDLRLQWTEALDSSRTRSQGLLGFDSRSGRFYSSTVDSAGSGAEFLTGTLSTLEPLVTFIPIAPASGQKATESFTWTMVDQDHFTWAPLDRGWRAVLTREP